MILNDVSLGRQSSLETSVVAINQCVPPKASANSQCVPPKEKQHGSSNVPLSRKSRIVSQTTFFDEVQYQDNKITINDDECMEPRIHEERNTSSDVVESRFDVLTKRIDGIEKRFDLLLDQIKE